MFGIRKLLPTLYDACASLAKVLSASPFKPSLAGLAVFQAQPAWLNSQLGQWMIEGYSGWLETDREGERGELKMCRLEREDEPGTKLKREGGREEERLNEWNYSKRILIKWNSSRKLKWDILKIRVQSSGFLNLVWFKWSLDQLKDRLGGVSY